MAIYPKRYYFCKLHMFKVFHQRDLATSHPSGAILTKQMLFASHYRQ